MYVIHTPESAEGFVKLNENNYGVLVSVFHLTCKVFSLSARIFWRILCERLDISVFSVVGIKLENDTNRVRIIDVSMLSPP